jgi:predicted DNA-binding protein (MmcQ/YjbR family)
MLNLEDIRMYCLQKPFTTEDMPFGEDTLAFRVMNKIFLLTGLTNNELSVNMKCDPDHAIELRERYTDILPGYHMNKRWWNTVRANGEVPDKLFLDLIDHSYALVVKGLPRSLKEQIEIAEN